MCKAAPQIWKEAKEEGVEGKCRRDKCRLSITFANSLYLDQAYAINTQILSTGLYFLAACQQKDMEVIEELDKYGTIILAPLDSCAQM